MYNILLFDLDDTVLDFRKSELKALEKVFNSFNIPFTKENITAYRNINHRLWVDFEGGKIEREQIFEIRFPKFLKMHGHHVTGLEVDMLYRSFLAEGHDVKEGARELLADLRKRGHRLFAVTNGLLEMQARRLKDSGLDQFFEQVFISEETGYKKPDIEFFDYVFDRIPQFDKKLTVIIGDMLHADILGGINAGIDTIWIQEKEALAYIDIEPTYTVHSIKELRSLLERGYSYGD